MFLRNKITNEICEFGTLQGVDWQELTKSEIDAYEVEQVKSEKIAQCKSYLSSTDWQIIRLADPTSGEALKEGVAENRALGRSLQDDVMACVTLEELNTININFE